MVASIMSSNSTASVTNAASESVQNETMGKDTFMKLLIAQVANQDPLNPMDDTAMVAQLAQFSALEQATATNSTLQLIAQQQVGLANSTIASLVGSTVTVKGSTVSISESNRASQCVFGLGASASKVEVKILDANGKAIRTIEAGARPAGQTTIPWDGRDDNGVVQPAGAYTVVVSAKTEAGAPVSVSQETTGMLASVSFENGYANLHLENGATAPAANLISVKASSGK